LTVNKINIIIPVYNEADNIGELLNYLLALNIPAKDIIIIDGGSRDDTMEVAKKFDVQLIESDQKSRAKQMNAGAKIATQNILYFLHADTYPPKDFLKFILDAYNNGIESGCFRLKFDFNHWFLNVNAWFTRFNLNRFRFGDQSLFVSKKVFDRIKGFNENMILLEDQEIIKRIRRHSKFIVFKSHVTTSARKYLKFGVFRLQCMFYYIYTLYALGFSQQSLVKQYRKLK